ncbi:DNA polymerase III subunit beta [bacterium]|nr:DNA polymerase III subunit beta [bacterium]|tara:strand:+ start:4222 stop:5316 length:1095 start_codon:yes stop_codon:yes gene_type:complete
MKFECKLDNLKQKILLLEKITGRNLSLPILNSVLFIVKGNTILLRATNLEVGVEITIPAKIGKEGTFAIEGRVISSFLNSLDGDENITFEQLDNTISITTKKHSTIIKITPHDDFPSLPKIHQNKAKIRPQILIEGLRSVWFSASVSDIKPEIASIYLYSQGRDLVFVATDSFRLAEKTIKGVGVNIDPILIPLKNALEIGRFFDGAVDELSVSSDKNQLALETKEIYFTTRLTDGVYPDYRQIIPKGTKTQVVVLKKDFVNSLKTANIFVDDFNKINLKIIPEDSLLEIESKNTKVGENTTQIEAHLEGDPIEMSFNFKYLSEVFPIITHDSVALRFNDTNKPLIISPVGDPSLLYLVMPVNR